MRILVVAIALGLTACSSNVELKYPEKQTNNVAPAALSSTMSIARSAYDFKDRDIQVPANFDTQGLTSCNFSADNESDACPLKKKSIRIYFGDNKVVSKNAEELAALQTLTNQRLGLMLENQLAGVNRFRIVTQDSDAVEQEKANQMLEQDAMEIAQLMMEKQTLRPDYLVKVDTVKTAERFYAEYNGVARYNIEMTSSVIDPYTKEKLSHPNIGKIRVKGTDVRNKEFFVYTEVNNRYYTGYNYADKENIAAVFSSMASKAFDIMLSRLLQEMPSSAQVNAFRNGQATLDRGQNAGILNDETMILFSYEMGFVEPIAVAVVRPSKTSSIARIVRWKDNQLANTIKKASEGQIYRAGGDQKIFAVSVGLPENFVKNRL
jgi:hypothetical protein